MALKEASFVIDARNSCNYKKKGFRKFLILEIELLEDHNLIAPVVFDAGVDKKEQLRSLRYLPLTSRRLLVKDFWYSKDNQLNMNEMRNALNSTITIFGWKIARIIREDSGVVDVPLSEPIILNENRVINLSGIFHDTTGCSIPLATKLIDRMVQTSFRLGEIKEVVNKFRKESEADKKFFRFLNRLMIEEKQHVFETIYQQPYQVVERFSRGELNVLDRSRIIVGRSSNQIKNLMSMVLPYSVMSQVQLPNEKKA
jgi:lycopene cyclase